MSRFGDRMIHEDQAKSIIEAIPGLSDNSIRENMMQILSIPYAGCRYYLDGKFYYAGERAYFWFPER